MTWCWKRCAAAMLCMGGVILIGNPALAQGAKKAKPQPPKKPTVAAGTLGTKQMEGKEGQLNVAYTLKEEYLIGGFNLTITGVSYTTRSIPLGSDTFYRPEPDQKMLQVRFIIQNPKKEDINVGGGNFATALFQAVGSDNKTYEAEGMGLAYIESAKLAPGKGYPFVELTLKPGQKSETLVACIPIPDDISVPKLIVKRGRFGTAEQVIRFDLRDKVKPDFGLFADPENPTTPRKTVSAEMGKPYALSSLEVTLEGFKREAGPLKADEVVAEEGSEFITGTVTIKNISNSVREMWSDCKPIIILVDEDGEKKEFAQTFLRPSRSAFVEGARGEPLTERKGQFYFQIPKGLKVKSIEVYEYNFPEYRSRRLTFDVSAL